MFRLCMRVQTFLEVIIFMLSFEASITLVQLIPTKMTTMKVVAVRTAQVAHPTGDPNFSVMQGFPDPFSAQESDPFLMCDVFGPTPSKGVETNPDKFQVGWHPHRGMDILTYLTEGIGRHADSLGNRETFASPGMQWISVVSVSPYTSVPVPIVNSRLCNTGEWY
jgi:hypothetical protein